MSLPCYAGFFPVAHFCAHWVQYLTLTSWKATLYIKLSHVWVLLGQNCWKEIKHHISLCDLRQNFLVTPVWLPFCSCPKVSIPCLCQNYMGWKRPLEVSSRSRNMAWSLLQNIEVRHCFLLYLLQVDYSAESMGLNREQACLKKQHVSEGHLGVLKNNCVCASFLF